MKAKSLWHSFWFRMWSVTIQAKIMGIVALGVGAVVLALVWHTYHDFTLALRSELQQRGIVIGTGLAIQSRDLILTDNLLSLYRLAQHTRDADQDVIYIFVLDASDNVLVHTFDGGFPANLLGKNQVSSGKSYSVQVFQTEYGTIQDVAIPVLGNKAGVIHVGLSETTINAAVSEHIRHILLWSASIFVLALLAAYTLASILTKPVYRLAQAARAVGMGDFRWQAPIWAKDEIGRLGAAFTEMSEELKRKEALREQLLARVISAQEEERKRIARELHDETAQALTSLMLGLKYVADSADASSLKEKIDGLRSLTSETMDRVRHLATELRPSILDDIGLFAAIQKYTREYSAKTNIPVDCYVADIEEPHLSPESEVTVYRIIQEALTNIAKYAEAKEVSVVLRHRDSSLVAVVEDDGKGFDVNGVLTSTDEKNLGLFGMYERASLVGGKLTIESKLGEGTTIFLEIPLKQQRGHQ